jgi:predicted dehydrogenase
MAQTGIGILGFAHSHVNAYCQQYIHDDDVRLVIAWDHDETRGKRQAEHFGMNYSPRLEDVLFNPDVDAVIVSAETNRHADLVIAAAEAGKNILCQKPMALSLRDCDRMIEAVERAGVRFAMAHQMRQDPANQAMKRVLDDGSLGEISVIRRRHCIPVLLNPNFGKGDTAWHIDPEQNMGMWMDDASHATDFLHWMMGMPVSVMAEIDNVVTHHAPDDTGVAVFRFASGAVGILLNSSVTLAGENTTEIYGTRGTLIQNYGDGPSCNLPRPPDSAGVKVFIPEDGDKEWRGLGIPIPGNHGERIQAVARPFIDWLRTGKPDHATAQDGRTAVEMILAAYRSAAKGRRVSFPFEETVD